MAEHLAAGRQYPMLQEEPQHCAETMLTVLESLWKARSALARLKRSKARDDGGASTMVPTADH